MVQDELRILISVLISTARKKALSKDDAFLFKKFSLGKGHTWETIADISNSPPYSSTNSPFGSMSAQNFATKRVFS